MHRQFIYIYIFGGRPPCIRVNLPGEALHVNLTVLLLFIIIIFNFTRLFVYSLDQLVMPSLLILTASFYSIQASKKQ